jgi:hypothetical protein
MLFRDSARAKATKLLNGPADSRPASQFKRANVLLQEIFRPIGSSSALWSQQRLSHKEESMASKSGAADKAEAKALERARGQTPPAPEAAPRPLSPLLLRSPVEEPGSLTKIKKAALKSGDFPYDK